MNEVGSKVDYITIIIHSIYGLNISAEDFHTILANFLRTWNVSPSYFNRDIWMRIHDDGTACNYICTHVTDYSVVIQYPIMWIDHIIAVFLVKEYGPQYYYLVNAYTYYDGQDTWTYVICAYATETVSKLQRLYDYLPKKYTPLPVFICHGVLGTSPLLNLDDYKFQILFGILHCIITIGKPELFQLVAYFN